MGKYLKNFNTKEEYEAFKASSEYLTPNVSFIKTAGSVINDSYQIESGEKMIYFDVEKLNSLQGLGIYSALELLGCITVNTYKTTVPIGYTIYDSFVGTEKVIVGFQPYNFYYYVAFPNSVTVPTFLHLGSQPMPVQDIVGEKMSFYELLEYINSTLKDFGEDMGIPINEIKTCEVTKEEVMQWLQTPVEE
jgi:hypothetical protein